MTSISRRPRWAGALALFGVVVLVTAACGSDDDDPAAAGGTDPTEAAGSFSGGDPYKLMVIGPLTPSAALPTPFAELAVGARAGAAAVNDNGGVNGREVEILECDTRGEPNGGTECAQRAVEEGVTAVVGSFDFQGDYLSVLAEADIPTLAPFATDAELTSDIAYPITGSSYTLLAGEISLLAAKGAETISFVAAGSAAETLDLAGRWEPVVELNPGLEVEGVPVAPDATDLAAYASAAAEAEGMGIALQEAQIIPFMNTYRQIADGDRILSSDVNTLSPTVLEQLGELAEGIYAPAAFLPASVEGNAAVDEFVDYMDAIDADAPKNDFSTTAYLGVKLFAEVGDGIEDLDGARLMEALDQAEPIDLGLLPPVSFTTPSDAVPGVTRLFNTGVVYLQVRDGVLVAESTDFVDAYTGEPLS